MNCEAERERLRRRLEENFGYAMGTLLPSLANLLVAGRALHGADLDRFLIFTVIATRTFAHPGNAQVALDPVLEGEVERFESLHTNARSISESTGIPRETVRRKVKALIEEGWVLRKGDDLAAAPVAAREMETIRALIFDAVALNHALATKLLAKQPS